MAQVTITIPNSSWTASTNFVTWDPPNNARVSMGSSLSVDGNTNIFFARMQLPRTSQNANIQLATGTEGESLAGPDFSTRMELIGTIQFTASNGDSVTITGINDSTEPYSWLPSNIGEVNTFANTLAGLTNRSLTVTFDDDPPFVRARQVIQIPGANYSVFLQNSVRLKEWVFTSGAPQLVSAFQPGNEARHFDRLRFIPDGRILLSFGSMPNEGGTIGGKDLSGRFEFGGGFIISFGSTVHTFLLDSADVDEPYVWTPDNSADVIATYNALPNAGNQAATLTLFNYFPLIPTMKFNGVSVGAWKFNGTEISAAKFNGTVLQ